MNKDIQELKERVKNLRILYVEDEDEMRMGSEMFLNKFFTSVEVAKDGLEGLIKYKDKKYDIVFTDIMMPKMDGEEMIVEIKKLSDNVFCIALTASEVRLENIKEVSDLYFRKPIAYQDMVIVMQAIVKKFHL